ncbi:LamB/YcsF family protein [Siminovitchia terrae]|uniref:5-oxoprolinase subunit A n=1 Tax=Siminovitchia terrae TaxID=1914933 RepID=A0A429X7H1_SIMTE|nr:5-oxoprolinase subunit PxpA [Siminovitchia terrae]RST59388.1 LamB/YcsF family protein [Siminovitchia terrae]GIN92882.1 LamB/YcsF family protein [Siminovitchia terrae]GIN97486.1 LamB/YcsF family protein [Siminovitchia terrae]
MKKTIDLNCDMGESFGHYKLGNDDEVIQYISSANVACGFHAGDPNIMDHTVKIAKEHGVEVGAHPSLPDLAGFGRRNMDIPRDELMNLIIYQIGALDIFCQKHGVNMTHVKPHGNLNNMADSDEQLAINIVDAILSVRPDLTVFVKPHSQLHKVAERKGLPFKLEIFADRSYHKDFSLVSRREEGAVISDPEFVAERIIRMVTEGKVKAITGEEIEVNGETICVHGDTPTALEMIKIIKRRLEEAGIEVNSPFA